MYTFSGFIVVFKLSIIYLFIKLNLYSIIHIIISGLRYLIQPDTTKDTKTRIVSRVDSNRKVRRNCAYDMATMARGCNLLHFFHMENWFLINQPLSRW
ncbi:hypothetical protein Hanom_Chr10g00881311 [Helianthus anomalus]